MEGTWEKWQGEKPRDRKAKEGADGGRVGEAVGPTCTCSQSQGLRGKGQKGKEKNAGEWAGSGEDGQWGLWGLPSKAGERRRGEGNADEALPAKSLKEWQLRREAEAVLPGN